MTRSTSKKAKIHKWKSVQQNFCAAKGIINTVKREHTEWERKRK
jgi:hypothetical protein